MVDLLCPFDIRVKKKEDKKQKIKTKIWSNWSKGRNTSCYWGIREVNYLHGKVGPTAKDADEEMLQNNLIFLEQKESSEKCWKRAHNT